MTTNKKAADNKALQVANQTALKGFPKAKLKAAIDNMAAEATAADNATATRQAAALDVCELAHRFALTNDSADRDTIVEGWKSNVKLVTMELAVAGNRFAELTEGKDGKAPTAKLTGYGNNVLSIAKGCIEFDVAPADTAGQDGDASYREVRKLVEGKRAEKRRAENPDGALVADAKEACREAAKSLIDLVAGTDDLENIEALTAAFAELEKDAQSQLDAAMQIEAEAEAA